MKHRVHVRPGGRHAPDVELEVADMAERAVPPPVDAMLCLFSAIGYVYPEARLARSVENFARGLKPGGVLIVEPWLDASAFTPGLPSMQTYDATEIKLCRMSMTRREGDLSVLDFHWVASAIGWPEVRRAHDQHRLWLCPLEKLMGLLLEAGIPCRVEARGLTTDRLLLVGRRS